jgi:hypothetical protein
VFGSDWPMADPAREIAAIRALGYDEETTAGILGGQLRPADGHRRGGARAGTLGGAGPWLIPVLVDQRGDATWITLNRPDRRNAYDPEMAEAIVDALRRQHPQPRRRRHRGARLVSVPAGR